MPYHTTSPLSPTISQSPYPLPYHKPLIACHTTRPLSPALPQAPSPLPYNKPLIACHTTSPLSPAIPQTPYPLLYNKPIIVCHTTSPLSPAIPQSPDPLPYLKPFIACHTISSLPIAILKVVPSDILLLPISRYTTGPLSVYICPLLYPLTKYMSSVRLHTTYILLFTDIVQDLYRLPTLEVNYILIYCKPYIP